MVNNQNIRIGHLNTYHLCNKISDICAFIKKEQIDILGISESRLHDMINDSVVGIPGYDILRRDAAHPGHTGLVVYINHKLRNSTKKRRHDFELQSIECILLELNPHLEKERSECFELLSMLIADYGKTCHQKHDRS